MNILITGGSGFIGSNLADELLKEGNNVISVDNFETGRRDNLNEHKNLVNIEGDIVDYDMLDKLCKKYNVEIIVHCAASYKDPNNWENDAKTNILGTINVVRLAKKYNMKKIIYFQTALCYGTNPIESPITLNHPILPEGSSYSISKTSGEQYIHLSGVNYTTFRLANVYGPRNISGPLPTFYNRISNKKSCFVVNTKRDFVYINDLVDVVLKSIYEDHFGTFHVSSGSDVSIEELFQATINSMGIEYPVEKREKNKDDASTILLDPSKTQKEFNWKTKINLQEGVNETIKYYDKYGVNQTFTHLTNKD